MIIIQQKQNRGYPMDDLELRLNLEANFIKIKENYDKLSRSYFEDTTLTEKERLTLKKKINTMSLQLYSKEKLLGVTTWGL